MKTLTGLLAASLLSLTIAYSNVRTSEPIVCPCQYKYDPVCGSDGVTYMNQCVLDCTSKTREYQIETVSESECDGVICTCQYVDLPMCTLDGQTYPNECQLGCENRIRIANGQPIVYLAYRTSCRGYPGYCTNVTFPVCGSDNVEYRNRCVLDYVNTYNSQFGLPLLTVKNNGACSDGYLCPVTKQPICASDSNIYNNNQ